MRAFVTVLALLGLATGAGLAADPPKKKVLIVGIDGCRPDAFEAAKEAKHFHELIRDGAFASKTDVLGDRVIAGVTTATGPGWSSALTGSWADKHGVKDNSFKGETLKQYPNFFRRVKDARPKASTVAVVTWKQFSDFVFSEADGCRFVLNGDAKGYEEGDRVAAKTAAKVLKDEDPDALFVYFGNMDSTGHGYGFHPKSPKYTASLEVIDGHVGEVLKAMKNRPNYANEDWLVIVCTDHGGKGREHGLGEKEPEIRTGFMILYGPSVVKGPVKELTGNADVAVTALAHLGVPVKPEWKLDGRAVGLKK